MSGSFSVRRLFLPRNQPCILRRSDFFKIKALPKPPHEQVALLLGMNLGFRLGEIRHSRYEHFFLDEGVIYVDDSKDKRLYPLPLEFEVAKEFMKVKRCPNGYVLQRRNHWPKIADKAVATKKFWVMLKRWAAQANVLNHESFTPNHLRAFFAKEWVRKRYLANSDPNIPLLSTMMRHRDVVYTWIYITKFVYLEDLRNEINRFQIPIEPLKTSA